MTMNNLSQNSTLQAWTRTILTLIALSVTLFSYAQHETPAPIEGRWDIVIEKDGKFLPSWLEVEHSGVKTLVGRFVYAGGSARPISEVKFADGKFSFSIPPQWEKEERNLDFEGTVSGNNLTGTMVFVDGKTYNWTAVRAPMLKRTGEPVWGKPIKLFSGTDLKGWH